MIFKRYVDDRDFVRHVVALHYVEYRCYEASRPPAYRRSRLEMREHAVLLLKFVYGFNKASDIRAVVGELEPAAEIYPFHAFEIFAEFAFDYRECRIEVRHVFFEENVRMESRNAFQRVWICRKRRLEFANADSEARAGRG